MPSSLPVLHTVGGAASTATGPGYPADTARLLAGKWEWAPCAYPAAVYPMGGSIDTGIDTLVANIAARPGQFGLASYSEGAIVACRVWRDYLLDPGGSLHHRLQDCIASVTWGNPLRADGVAHGNVYSGLAVPDSGGIGRDRLLASQVPSWWLDWANIGDLYTDIPVDTTQGRDDETLFDFVTSANLLDIGVIMADITANATQFNDVQSILDIVPEAIKFITWMIQGTTTHVSYNLTPAVVFLASVATGAAGTPGVTGWWAEPYVLRPIRAAAKMFAPSPNYGPMLCRANGRMFVPLLAHPDVAAPQLSAGGVMYTPDINVTSVVYDATGIGATNLAPSTGISWGHTASGSDRGVVVIAHADAATNLTCTYGGVAMTRYAQVGTTEAVFGLVDPSSGPQTVALASSNSVGLTGNSVSYRGVNAMNNPVSGTNWSSNPSFSMNPLATHMAVGGFGATGHALSGFSQTERWNNATNLVMGDAAGPGSKTFSATMALGGSGYVGVYLTP